MLLNAKWLMFGGDDISESEIEVVLGKVSVTHMTVASLSQIIASLTDTNNKDVALFNI